MKLEKLANKVVAVVTAEDPLDLAIQHMWRLNIRHLPVVRQGVPIGMVSERDVLLHVCWLDQARPPLAKEPGDSVTGATRIDQIMTTPAIVLSADDPLEKAARLMLNKQISCVPLAAHDHIVGIVTEIDFLKCFLNDESLIPSAKCRETNVADLMSAHIFSVQSHDATLAAIRLMRDKQVRHVPVLEDGKLVGILSDRDVLRGTRREEGDHAISVRELRVAHEVDVRGIMSTHVEVLECSATLAEAARKFVVNKIGSLPIVKDGKLVGILTESDLLRAFLADCEG